MRCAYELNTPFFLLLNEYISTYIFVHFSLSVIIIVTLNQSPPLSVTNASQLIFTYTYITETLQKPYYGR